MYISPAYQRKGYGTKLMIAVEKFARENNFISITLLTSMDKPAFTFYQKFGCKHLERLAFMYKRIV
jgi:GNAT superfamily N-acetyltransferase